MCGVRPGAPSICQIYLVRCRVCRTPAAWAYHVWRSLCWQKPTTFHLPLMLVDVGLRKPRASPRRVAAGASRCVVRQDGCANDLTPAKMHVGREFDQYSAAQAQGTKCGCGVAGKRTRAPLRVWCGKGNTRQAMLSLSRINICFASCLLLAPD